MGYIPLYFYYKISTYKGDYYFRDPDYTILYLIYNFY